MALITKWPSARKPVKCRKCLASSWLPWLQEKVAITKLVTSSSRTKLKHLVIQNIVYTISNSKVKKPKRLLYLSIIKQLTNNTEIINIVHTLNHSISYSILNETHTENTYIVHDVYGNIDAYDDEQYIYFIFLFMTNFIYIRTILLILITMNNKDLIAK